MYAAVCIRSNSVSSAVFEPSTARWLDLISQTGVPGVMRDEFLAHETAVLVVGDGALVLTELT